jgi:hypothetical protein
MVKSNTLYVKLYDTGIQVVKHHREYPSPGVAYPLVKRHRPLIHDVTR